MAKKRKPNSEPTQPAADEVSIADGVRVPREAVAHIIPDLWPLTVSIDTLRPDPRNARIHGDKNRGTIRALLQRLGQQKPISVAADGEILAGNGTYAEALALGWKYIARVRSNLSGPAAREWAIGDNRSAELAEWDRDELNRSIAEIEEQLGEFDLASIGFSDADLKALENNNFEAAHAFAPRKPKPETAEDARPQLGDLVYAIKITCRDESHQAELLDRLEKEGLECQPLTL